MMMKTLGLQGLALMGVMSGMMLAGGCELDHEGPVRPDVCADGGCAEECPDGSTWGEGYCEPDPPMPPPSSCEPECPDEMNCIDGECRPDSFCGAMTVEGDVIVANAQLLLDRSCSMNGTATTDGDGSTVSKWEAAVRALGGDLLISSGDTIRWGLTLFPRPVILGERPDWDMEHDGGPDIEISATAAREIADRLTRSRDPELDLPEVWSPGVPTCETPTAAAFHRAMRDPALMEDARGRHLVLVTDGMPTFSKTNGDVNRAREVENYLSERYAEGVTTHIIGFGRRVSSKNLNRWAQAGGAGRIPVPEGADRDWCTRHMRGTGETCYYLAEDTASLQEALRAIEGRILQCDFEVSFEGGQEVLCPEMLEVYVGGHKLAPTEFHYDAESGRISLLGEACQSTAERISVVQPARCCLH